MIPKYAKAALQGLYYGGRRTLLAVLGITMSIYLVVSLIAIGRGVQTQIQEQVTAIGSDVIGISSTSPNDSSQDSATQLVNGLSQPTLTLDELAVVKRQPTVAAAAPIRYLAGDVSYNDRSTTPTFLIATTHEYAEARDSVELESGRFFNASEQDDATPKVVIGAATKQALFDSNDPIGERIVYGDRELEVVGVMDPVGGLSQGSSSNNLENAVWGPPSLVAEVEQRNVFSLILAKVSPTSAVAETAKVIEAEISDYRDDDTFIVATEEDRLNTSQTILSVLSAFIGIIALITLVISGIGVMNVMVLSVTERTKEIGIRKTVGATSRNIFMQFLIEAAILAALGGVFGIILTVVTVYAVQMFAPINPELTLQLVFYGFILSLGTGTIFGISPALSAANREPIDALQTDRS